MLNALILSNLQKLVSFLGSNTSSIKDQLNQCVEDWEGQTAWVVLDSLSLPLDSGFGVQCHVVTKYNLMGTEHSRFCFHLTTGNNVVKEAYVACGRMFAETTPPVIVGNKSRALSI